MKLKQKARNLLVAISVLAFISGIIATKANTNRNSTIYCTTTSTAICVTKLNYSTTNVGGTLSYCTLEPDTFCPLTRITIRL